MTDRAELERVARAIWATRQDPPHEDYALKMGLSWDEAQRAANAAIEAMAASTGEGVTEEMWGGLARDIMMWLDFPDKTPRALFKHLKRLGREIPQWLVDEPEMKALDHVPSKGTRCVIIYRAMLEDYRASLAPTETGTADTGNTESVRSMRAGSGSKTDGKARHQSGDGNV